MITVRKGDRKMKVGTMDKAHFIDFIPAAGDEVQFWNPYLGMNVYGEVESLKSQTATVRDGNLKMKFTLRNSGEWIEKGFQACDRNRRLIKE